MRSIRIRRGLPIMNWNSFSFPFLLKIPFIFISFCRSSSSSSTALSFTLGTSKEVEAYHGETLRLYRVTRQMMAAYMCIASNDVPPAVSKRVPLNVNCKSQHFRLNSFIAITILSSSFSHLYVYQDDAHNRDKPRATRSPSQSQRCSFPQNPSKFPSAVHGSPLPPKSTAYPVYRAL